MINNFLGARTCLSFSFDNEFLISLNSYGEILLIIISETKYYNVLSASTRILMKR